MLKCLHRNQTAGDVVDMLKCLHRNQLNIYFLMHILLIPYLFIHSGSLKTFNKSEMIKDANNGLSLNTFENQKRR